MTFIHKDSFPIRTFGEVVSLSGKVNVPVESAALIENFIFEDEIVKAMYDSPKLKKWFDDNQIEMLDFGGGESGITATMLVDIPPIVISRVRKESGKTIGHKKAREIIEKAKEEMKKEPFY
jgi:hypothetical protein